MKTETESKTASVKTPIGEAGKDTQVTAPNSVASQTVSDSKEEPTIDTSEVIKMQRLSEFSVKRLKSFIAKAESDAGKLIKLADSKGLESGGAKALRGGIDLRVIKSLMTFPGLMGDAKQAQARYDVQVAAANLRDALVKAGVAFMVTK